MIKIKSEKIPENYKMVSFDVKSFFYFGSIRTHHWHHYKGNLWKTWNISSIYEKWNKDKLLTICRKNVHFSFKNDNYIQVDGVAIGSPLGPVIVTWKCINSKIKWSCQKIEALCGWHLCIRQAWFDWICFVRTEFVSW